MNFNFKFKLYKEKKVDEAKFFLFFLWCLLKKKNTFQLERRVAEVQLLSPFSHVGKWTIFYFLLSSLQPTSTLPSADDCDNCWPALVNSIPVIMMILLLCFITCCSRTRLQIWWVSLFEPNHQHKRCFAATCWFSRVTVLILWSSFVLKECNTETVIFHRDISWIQTEEEEDVCSFGASKNAFGKDSFSSLYYPEFKAINIANAVSHYKIIYLNKISFQSQKWKFALLRFRTINKK